MTKLLHFTLANACIFTLLITLAHHVPVTNADFEHVCSSDSWQQPATGICGSQLADTIGDMCRAFGSLYSSHKRDTGNDERLKGILLNKKDAFSYLAKRQASRTSVVCECCIHSCRPTELLQYCDLPSSSFRRSLRSDDDRRGNSINS